MGDTNTAGTVDNDAGTLVSGAAAASAEEEDGANFYNIAVRYEVDEGDITFDVDFSFDSLAENFVGSVLFDMGAEEDADVLTFWWLSDFHVPAMESFNGDAATDLTVADGDLKSDWAWSGYDVEIGASARFAVTRAVASPDAAVDVSFAGDDFTFTWVLPEINSLPTLPLLMSLLLSLKKRRRKKKNLKVVKKKVKKNLTVLA